MFTKFLKFLYIFLLDLYKFGYFNAFKSSHIINKIFHLFSKSSKRKRSTTTTKKSVSDDDLNEEYSSLVIKHLIAMKNRIISSIFHYLSFYALYFYI